MTEEKIMNNSLRRLVNLVTIAGVTLLAAFVASWLTVLLSFLYGSSRFYNDVHRGASAVRDVALGLNLLWVVISGVLAVACWRATTRTFRIVLLISAILASLCLGALR
jgi:mannose/fructose/N-acetylgalactosamine-specific phosphotransferase system component IID